MIRFIKCQLFKIHLLYKCLISMLQLFKILIFLKKEIYLELFISIDH